MTVAAMGLGIVLGSSSHMRISGNPVLSSIASAISAVFRGARRCCS